MDRFHSFYGESGRFYHFFNLAQSPGGHARADWRRNGSCFSYRESDDRPDLGATGVGNLVDLGLAADFDTCGVVDLRQLSHAAAVFFRGRNSGDGSGYWNLWRSLRAVCLFLNLVFPDAASTAGDWWRRVNGSADAACALAKLAGIFMFWRTRVLVAVSLRVFAS